MALCSSNVTSGFIDLATFDEIEKYLYGGPDATAYFVRETCKSTWFTQVPVILSGASGQTGFGNQWSVNVSRAGDYLLHNWLRLTLPEVSVANLAANEGLRWTRNLMHNLILEATVTFNDLQAQKFNNFSLDFWAAFTVPAGKRNGYDNMIGNVDALTQPHGPGFTNTGNIPSTILNLPLPYWYSRDTGVSLPTAALPYNEIRLNFCFRDWAQLLILQISDPSSGADPCRAAVIADLVSAPVLTAVQVWANYAIVSNDERKRMACAPRDILIEQFQSASVQNYSPAVNATPSFDIRFSHAIKVLFWAARNKTCANEFSNYTAASPVFDGGVLDFTPSGAVDPIVNTSLIYESTQRLSQMGSDYFSLVQPWFHAPVIPLETGYHMYSYSLDFYSLDPQGSTNYGKLTNISIVPQASAGGILGAQGGGGENSGQDYAQLFDFVVLAINNNIIRISGGALGFPVL